MTTTIGDAVGRPEHAREADGAEETLDRARALFADCARFLETELDRLFEAEIDPADPAATDRLRDVRALIALNQQAMLKVLDLEAKLGLAAEDRAGREIDLEAARAEIDRRLARLAR